MRTLPRLYGQNVRVASPDPQPPEVLSADQLDAIREALTSRGATLPCPRCANNTFTLEDMLVLMPVQASLMGYQLGGQTIPSAVTSCSRCGWISMHALGVLGLLYNPLFNPSALTGRDQP